MAVEVRPLSTRIQVRFDLGVDSEGAKVTRLRTFSSIKTDAPVQDIYDVVEALTNLQAYPVNYIRKVDQSEIVNVE